MQFTYSKLFGRYCKNSPEINNDRILTITYSLLKKDLKNVLNKNYIFSNKIIFIILSSSLHNWCHMARLNVTNMEQTQLNKRHIGEIYIIFGNLIHHAI